MKIFLNRLLKIFINFLEKYMNKFTILGSGSSLGAPWITNHWGNLKKKSRKDIASECEDIVRDGFLQSLNRGV